MKSEISKIFICFILIAAFCAGASANANEISAMSAAPTNLLFDDLNAPSLTAEEIGNGMIELIKSIKTTDDISPANIERVMKTKVKFDEKNRQSYGFSGFVRGTEQWSYNLSVYSYPVSDRKKADTLNFSFNPLTDDEKKPTDDYAPVCAVDFDAYQSELKKDGYSSSPYYAEHGRLLWWDFYRGAVYVRISASGESDERADHQCVSMVTINIGATPKIGRNGEV